jgi:tRNA A37 methylthiotransferase MiaB
MLYISTYFHYSLLSYTYLLNTFLFSSFLPFISSFQVKMLSDQGVKEITLLGQNVNSYADFSNTTNSTPTTHLNSSNNNNNNSSESLFGLHYAQGFHSVYRPRREGAMTFAELLDHVADINPEMRIRFTSPHPKDFSDDVLRVLRSRDNVCKQLHMPAQSGSSEVLKRMKRGYTREAYDALVEHVRAVLPGVALSTDMIAGFCEESQTEHEESVDLLKKVGYEMAFLFAYSEREKTHAARNYADTVPQDVKIHRLTELIATYRQGVYEKAKEEIGRRHLVLVEGNSKRLESQLTGRTDTFKRVVFEDIPIPFKYNTNTLESSGSSSNISGTISTTSVAPRLQLPLVHVQPGDYVAVQVIEAGGGTLQAIPLGRTSIQEFVGIHGSAVPLEKYN